MDQGIELLFLLCQHLLRNSQSLHIVGKDLQHICLCYHAGLGEDTQPLAGVPQLPDIAVPGKLLQPLHGRPFKDDRITILQKVTGEIGHQVI